MKYRIKKKIIPKESECVKESFAMNRTEYKNHSESGVLNSF